MKLRHTFTISDRGRKPVVIDIDTEGEHNNNIAWDAAKTFAKRIYGTNGKVGALRLDSWTQGGLVTTWDVFLGRRGRTIEWTVTGKNYWMTQTTEVIE